MTIDQRLYRLVRLVIPDESIAIDDGLGPSSYIRWDSITSLNLMFFVEQEFNVVFESRSFFDFRNVGDIRAHLERVVP